MSKKIILQGFKSFQSDRARVQLMLSMIAQIAGFDPRYISVTPNVKPDDYQGEGSPYGWYYRTTTINENPELVVQPIIWDEHTQQWKDFASPLISVQTLEGYLQTLQTAFSQFQNDLFEDLEEFKADAILSDTKDGQDNVVTTLPGIKNVIRMSEGEYAALEAAGKLKDDTMYIIMEV